MAAKKKTELRDSPDWERYAGAQMEEMKDMFQIIMEQTAAIPKMREQIDHILTWEESINLIPIMFEEIGHLREDVEVMKEAMKLIGRNTEKVEKLEKRVKVLEQELQELRAAQQ